MLFYNIIIINYAEYSIDLFFKEDLFRLFGKIYFNPRPDLFVYSISEISRNEKNLSISGYMSREKVQFAHYRSCFKPRLLILELRE